METKNYEKKFHRIIWWGIIGIAAFAAITGIVVNVINPDAVGLAVAVAIALSGSIVVYVIRRIKAKYGIITRDERVVNLQYKAMVRTVQVFMLCTIVVCFSVWFAEFFEIGEFDVQAQVTEVVASMVSIILCMYLAVYFYYQKKM